jgi:hypothetical protein
MPVIGMLMSRSRADTEGVLAAFRRGLLEHGFVEGRNVAIEYADPALSQPTGGSRRQRASCTATVARGLATHCALR